MIPKLLIAMLVLILTACTTTQNTFPQHSTPPSDAAFWQASTAVIWEKLQAAPLTQLQQGTSSPDANIAAWNKLALISKQYSTDTPALVNQLIAWRTANPNHPANALFPDNNTLTSLLSTQPSQIALLLPLQGALGSSGKNIRDGFLSAYYASRNHSQKQAISFYDTSTPNQSILTLYQQALAKGSDHIVGPLIKEDVQTLARNGNVPVTTLALNYTDDTSLPANFYEFGLSPLDEAQQLADYVIRAGHRHAIIIAPQDAWGQRVVKSLSERWQSQGGTISDTFYFSAQTDLNSGIANLLHVAPTQDSDDKPKETNKTILEQRRRQDFDAIFLLAPPASARQIVPLLKFNFTDNIPIYSTSIIYSGTPSAEDSDLNGVIFCETPWALKAAGSSSRLYAVGRDAYFLSSQIARLRALPNFPAYGATGALILTPQQKIYRQLIWVQMRDGRPA